jgi:hypothetical protein
MGKKQWIQLGGYLLINLIEFLISRDDSSSKIEKGSSSRFFK